MLGVSRIAFLVAVACASTARAENAGPAGITNQPQLGRNLIGMADACRAQYGPQAHPCRSAEIMRATQTGVILTTPSGAFVLPSVVSGVEAYAIDATGIATSDGGPVCLLLVAVSGEAASLSAGNCNEHRPVLCCATFQNELFENGFETLGAKP